MPSPFKQIKTITKPLAAAQRADAAVVALETEVMAHRYLREVLGKPVLSAEEQQGLEDEIQPMLSESSPVYEPATADYPYTEPQILRALAIYKEIHPNA